MARPQVADGGTASYMVGSCEYIEQAVADSRQGVVVQLGGLGEGLTTPHRENVSLLRNIHRQSLGPGLILWYDLSNERRTRDLILGMLGAYIGQIHSKWIFKKHDVGV
jgi:hypothetical protein